MSIKPENVNTSEECVHKTDISVPDDDDDYWVYLTVDDLHTLPIDWDALNEEELDAMLALIISIEATIKAINI